MNKSFIVLGIIGSIVICVCAFTIPSNPHEIIPAITYMSVDKPLWLELVIVGLFVYWCLLVNSYDWMIKKTKSQIS